MKFEEIQPFPPVPYVGSFQNGFYFRSGDPLKEVWRQIERIATIDHLSKVSKKLGHEGVDVKTASLRLQQAIEFREASAFTTTLTKPLLLYYSALNLIRGLLLVYKGNIGKHSHGLQHSKGNDILSCSATISKGGTFTEFSKSLGVKPDDIIGKTITLSEALSLIPEIDRDFSLLDTGIRNLVQVEIKAYFNNKTYLRYITEKVSDKDFKENWQSMLPWLKELCITADQPMTLEVIAPLNDEHDISDFCKKHFICPAELQSSAVWYDHLVWKFSSYQLNRLLAYPLVLFILSNISRYHPEIIQNATMELTDLSFVLKSSLDATERYFPQFMLELLLGRPCFFN